MIEVRRAARADTDALAILHEASLPDSLMTRLGPAALARFYAFLGESAHERVWVAEADGAVAGGCVVSDAPHTIQSRFARHRPLAFALDVARGVARDRGLRARLASRRDSTSSDPAHVPEVTQIFTDAGWRGKGLGARLLASCEADLRGRGHTKYFVHTQRDDNDAGIRFYRREGFVAVGESRSFGEAFLVMQKDLNQRC